MLHTFTGGDGSSPESALVQGSDGNFYGTTFYGGASSAGTIFVITPAGVLSTLHNFSGSDGLDPATSLVEGSDGNFYGTAQYGGEGGGREGFGTVFMITPAGKFTRLHRFDGSDGSEPSGPLVQGTDGNFYGTTGAGGANGNGAVFVITPAGSFTLLHSFDTSDGSQPGGGLVLGIDGNFYGATVGGGADDAGTVFQLTPAGGLTTLHSFSYTDGSEPFGLVQGSDGNFYGTTYQGGADEDAANPSGSGTIYKLTPSGEFTLLHSFDGTNGLSSTTSLVQGSDGSFYGTAYQTIFQIRPAGAYTVLDHLDDNGGGAVNGLVQGSDGSFYGTELGTTETGDGTIFKLTVGTVPSSFFAGEVPTYNGVYYLAFANGNHFGSYAYLADLNYIYHFDLGYEYVIDANDGQNGVYFYDFKSSDFFYTSPTFPFPYLYDFNLQSVVYYYLDPDIPGGGEDNDGTRYFYVFSTGQLITK